MSDRDSNSRFPGRLFIGLEFAQRAMGYVLVGFLEKYGTEHIVAFTDAEDMSKIPISATKRDRVPVTTQIRFVKMRDQSQLGASATDTRFLTGQFEKAAKGYSGVQLISPVYSDTEAVGFRCSNSKSRPRRIHESKFRHPALFRAQSLYYSRCWNSSFGRHHNDEGA